LNQVRVWGHVGESGSWIGETIPVPTLPHCHVYPRVTRIQEYCVGAASAYSSRQNVTYIFNALSNGQKRAELSNLKTSLTWHVRLSLQDQRHVYLRQLDRSNPDNTGPGSGAWQATSTCDSLTCLGYHTRNRTNTHPCLRAWQTCLPLTCQGYYLEHQTMFNTRQTLSPTS